MEEVCLSLRLLQRGVIDPTVIFFAVVGVVALFVPTAPLAPILSIRYIALPALVMLLHFFF